MLAVTLGILQYGWISRAAVTEGRRRIADEQRRMESAALDLRRAVESSFDDLRLAVSIMRTEMGMDAGSDVAAAEQALSGWFQQTPFTSLIRGAWLMDVAGSGAGESGAAGDGALDGRAPVVGAAGDSAADGRSVKIVHISIDSESGKLTRAAVAAAGLPAALQPAAKLVGDRTAAESSAIDEMRTALGDEGYVLVWAAIGSGSRALAVLEVDTTTYLNITLPYYLKRDAPAYAATVHAMSELSSWAPTQNDTRGADGGTQDFTRRMFLSVPNVWYAGLFRTSLETRANTLALPPLDAVPGPPSLPGSSQQARVVEVMKMPFSVKDSIGFISYAFSEAAGFPGVRMWLVSNMAISIGIILFLLAALVAALLLFVRMRELRTAEMEFVASMSHELRLPITVIRVIADSLSAGIIRDESRMTKYGDQIRKQTSRLSTMVESILLSAGLQGEGTRPSVSAFRPHEVVERIVEELAALAERHGTSIQVAGVRGIEGGQCIETGTTVSGDANGFSLVLRNLLMNAIVHAFPPAPGESRCIAVRICLDRPSLLRLEVSDNGPGIPRKEQKAIFEPFARTSKSLSEQHQGSGLGLHIARRVVRLSDGTLTLSSPYQDADGATRRGCRFIATMRCEETHDGE